MRNACLVAVSWILLAGCDPFYGPSIRNDYGFDVDVTLSYADGTSGTYHWPHCRQSFVGKGETALEKITFAKNGQVLREFNAPEIQSLIEQEKRVKFYHVWSVSQQGVTLLTSQDQGVCGKKE